MAWAQGPERLDGEPTIVVTTDRAMYAHGYVDRLPWEQVLHASWEDPILEVVMLDGRGSTEFLRITLDNAGSVPQVVFDRVTSTIVMRSRVELVGKRGATLVARRDRESDEVRWEVVFDAGSTYKPGIPRSGRRTPHVAAGVCWHLSFAFGRSDNLAAAICLSPIILRSSIGRALDC